jgi:hypothetical protein
LPITGYNPPEPEIDYASAWDKSKFTEDDHGIVWSNDFVYDGQFLRLAVDLTHRLLPAFYTGTGLPYPRVNLRHGIPFYENSPLNTKSSKGNEQKSKFAYMKAEEEITETCSAGAGSLVLEFTVLSRLTGDGRYEELAKRAFWAVWSYRSEIGLIGFGIDAESGKWVGPYSGVSKDHRRHPGQRTNIVSRLVLELIASTSMRSSPTFSCPRESDHLSTQTILGAFWTTITCL